MHVCVCVCVCACVCVLPPSTLGLRGVPCTGGLFGKVTSASQPLIVTLVPASGTLHVGPPLSNSAVVCFIAQNQACTQTKWVGSPSPPSRHLLSEGGSSHVVQSLLCRTPPREHSRSTTTIIASSRMASPSATSQEAFTISVCPASTGRTGC